MMRIPSGTWQEVTQILKPKSGIFPTYSVSNNTSSKRKESCPMKGKEMKTLSMMLSINNQLQNGMRGLTVAKASV